MSEWLLQRGKGKTIGPFATDEIVAGIVAGEIPPGTRVADPGGKSWVELTDVAPFAEALRARAGARSEGPSSEPREAGEPSTSSEAGAPYVRAAGQSPSSPPSAPSAPSAHAGARRPLRVAFGAATARGRARLRASAVTLTLAGATVLGLGASPLARSIFQARRALRDLSSVGGAALLVGAGLVLAGELHDRRGAQSGSATARGGVLVATLTTAVCAALALREAAALVARARLATTVTVAGAALLALVAVALTWSSFRVPARGRAAPLVRASAVALSLTLALGAGVARARRALEVVYVHDPLDAPAFRDARAASAWLAAERAGASRVDVAAALVEGAVPLPCGARARLLSDRAEDDALEIELLDGAGRGARLFVPRRAASPEPPRCP